MSGESLGGAYFDALYARDADPWGFRTRDYERAKYEDTVAALEGRRFATAVEVGCSIGELTARLAPCCDALLGVDVAEAALVQARERNAGATNVTFARMSLPDQRPPGRFDLIVLSEVLYYFSRADLARVADWVRRALQPGGVALLVHWLGETPDYPLTGDTAVEAFLADTGLPDTGLPDTGLPDTGLPDTGLPDPGPTAGGLTRAGAALTTDRRWRRELYRIDRLAPAREGRSGAAAAPPG